VEFSISHLHPWLDQWMDYEKPASRDIHFLVRFLLDT
jgi:hypothetical protein